MVGIEAVEVDALCPPPELYSYAIRATWARQGASRRVAAVAAAFKFGWMIGSNIELGVALAAHPHLAASTLGLDPHVPCDLLSPFYHEADVIAEPLPSDPIAPCLRKDTGTEFSSTRKL